MLWYVLLAASAGYIAFVEGPGLLAAWNVAPVAVAAVAALWARRGRHRPASKGAATGFAVGSAGLAVLGHAAFQIELALPARVASTSPLLFIFLPVYAAAAGAFGAAVGGAIGGAIGGEKPRGEA